MNIRNKSAKELIIVYISMLIIPLAVVYVSIQAIVSVYNKVIEEQNNYDTVYYFDGEIELVKDKYITLKVSDNGNTDSSVGDICEVYRYLITTDYDYNEIVDRQRAGEDIKYFSEDNFDFFGEKPVEQVLEVGDKVKVLSSMNISSDNIRMSALSIDKIA